MQTMLDHCAVDTRDLADAYMARLALCVLQSMAQ